MDFLDGWINGNSSAVVAIMGVAADPTLRDTAALRERENGFRAKNAKARRGRQSSKHPSRSERDGGATGRLPIPQSRDKLPEKHQGGSQMQS